VRRPVNARPLPTPLTVHNKPIIESTWNNRLVRHVAGELLIGLNVSARATDALRRSTEADLLRALPAGSRIIAVSRVGTARVELPQGADLFATIHAIAAHPAVDYAEPNVIHEIALVPNEYASLAALKASQWGLDAIGCPTAWETTTGDVNVVIAVVDSGIAGPEREAQMVYRWWSPGGTDHFYTEDPLGELAHGGGYVYEGAPFRLFTVGTAQTTPMYRWFNGATQDHFYTTDPKGELAPQSGYTFEGVTGSIGTTAAPQTIALYRWWSAGGTDHFYTTDPLGELAPTSGYVNEGVTGYVDPRAGTYLSHPDLGHTNRVLLNKDTVHDDNFPMDDLGHGTHVAGIASADTNNSVGVAGVSWLSSILVIKVFDSTGLALDSDFAAGVSAAVDFGIANGKRVVINYSGRATVSSKTMETAVTYAGDHNCVLVAAAGNDADHATGKSAAVGWPAAFATSHTNVVAVGAVDSSAALANFSNTGPELTLVAPGVDIRSTVPNYATTLNPTGASYLNFDGTSMATPHVTGVVALMLAMNLGLTPQRIREILSTTADHLGTAGRNDSFGWGRVNATRAVATLKGGVVFRWWNGNIGDHFYTTDASGELAPPGGYLYEGAPFRVFAIVTPGTTPLYRWYSAGGTDHFYTTDPNGELAPQSGYVKEGVLGYIASSQLPGTVALHRWWNPQIVDHFYTTDPAGELAPSSGYQPEGITGYVLPGP
jgi:subtilisin family serine protease